MSNDKTNGLPNKLFGATGKYPQGHLNDDDEGELRIGIGVSEGKVVINFGTPVVWIGFDADQAIELACHILGTAKKIKDEVYNEKDLESSK